MSMKSLIIRGAITAVTGLELFVPHQMTELEGKKGTARGCTLARARVRAVHFRRLGHRIK